jgi:hypothetical protein
MREKDEFDGLPAGIWRFEQKNGEKMIWYLLLAFGELLDSNFENKSKLSSSSHSSYSLVLWFLFFSSSNSLWSHCFILWMIRCWNCRVHNSMMMIPFESLRITKQNHLNFELFWLRNCWIWVFSWWNWYSSVKNWGWIELGFMIWGWSSSWTSLCSWKTVRVWSLWRRERNGNVLMSWLSMIDYVVLNDELAPFIGCHVCLRPNDFVTPVLDL